MPNDICEINEKCELLPDKFRMHFIGMVVVVAEAAEVAKMAASWAAALAAAQSGQLRLDHWQLAAAEVAAEAVVALVGSHRLLGNEFHQCADQYRFYSEQVLAEPAGFHYAEFQVPAER